MAELKLGKLPERTPVKLTIHLPPELHRALEEYSGLYEAAYGSREEVTELIPAMLAKFLESDRAFVRRPRRA